MPEQSVLTGAELVSAFLGELREQLLRNSTHEVEGTSDVIVWNVAKKSLQFRKYPNSTINTLCRQLVAAIKSQGKDFRLVYELVQPGWMKIRVAVA